MNTNNSEKKNDLNSQGSDKSIRHELMLALSGLYYAIACAYLPFIVSVRMGEWLTLVLSLAMCVLGGFALTKMAGSFKPIAGFAVIISIFVILGGAVLPMSLLVSFLSATCVYAILLLKRPSLPIWLLPVIPTAIGVVITRDVSGGLLSLATLPCSLALAFSIKRKYQRVGAVCRISAAMCAFITIAFAFTVHSAAGELSIAAAKELIDGSRAELTLMIEGVANEMSSVLGADTLGLDVSEMAKLAVDSAFNLLPAIIVTAANIAAYFIHSLFISVYFTTDEEVLRSLPMRAFEMSLTSAIVYIVSLVLMLTLVSPSLALWETAALNIALILAPGLILTTFGFIRALTLKKGPSCLGTMLYFGAVFLLVSLSGIAIMAVALAGAVLTVVAHVALKKKSQNK